MPDHSDCRLAVDEGGDTTVAALNVGTYVCGRTAEGRVFQIGVLSPVAGAGEVSSSVTVWVLEPPDEDGG